MALKRKNNVDLQTDDLLWHVEDTSEIVICEKGIPSRVSAKNLVLRTFLDKVEEKLTPLNEAEKIKLLENKLNDLEYRLKLFESGNLPNQNVTSDIRNISDEQAQKEIENLLSDGKTRYFDEIAEILNLDIRMVVESFKKLNVEGKLFVDEQSHKI